MKTDIKLLIFERLFTTKNTSEITLIKRVIDNNLDQTIDLENVPSDDESQ